MSKHSKLNWDPVRSKWTVVYRGCKFRFDGGDGKSDRDACGWRRASRNLVLGLIGSSRGPSRLMNRMREWKPASDGRVKTSQIERDFPVSVQQVSCWRNTDDGESTPDGRRSSETSCNPSDRQRRTTLRSARHPCPFPSCAPAGFDAPIRGWFSRAATTCGGSSTMGVQRGLFPDRPFGLCSRRGADLPCTVFSTVLSVAASRS